MLESRRDVLRPTLRFTKKQNDFSVNQLGEKDIHVKEGFEYNSGNNPHFLSIDEIGKFSQMAGI